MTTDRTLTTLKAHRGPFRFNLMRPAKKLGFFTSEWLTGLTSREDVLEEAEALLTDPRDTIVAVFVFSEPEQAHVTTIRLAQNVQ